MFGRNEFETICPEIEERKACLYLIARRFLLLIMKCHCLGGLYIAQIIFIRYNYFDTIMLKKQVSPCKLLSNIFLM